MSFQLSLNSNASSWGPDISDPNTLSSCLANIQKYPFEPSLKPDRLGRVCDFTFASYQRNQRDGGKYNIPPGFEEELQFQTVDNCPVPRARGGRYNMRKAPQKHSIQAFNQKQQQEKADQLGRQKRAAQKKQQLAQQARYQRMYNRHRTFAEWSVEPTPEWSVEAEIPLSQLPKLSLESSKITIQDVCWRGEVRYYDKQADRIVPKAAVPLQHLSNALDYYWVSTQDDDIIKEEILKEGSTIQVAATDQILACLMAAPQSKYSWHINITKIEDKLILDKADGSIVDLLTVNETAAEPPMQDDPNKLNRPPALGFEAVKVNQNLRQQVLIKKNEPAEKFEPAPFVEDGDAPASIAYRYRIFTLPGKANHSEEFGKKPVNLMTRAEVHAKLPDVPHEDSYVTICALNEFDVKSRKNWLTQIENQKGALLATEIRNNANKLQKWVAGAMIGGCEHLRLGYVTRRQPNNSELHAVLSVQSYKTKELGKQIELKPDNAWGIVRALIDMLMQKPDGRYVLLKDPMKPVMRLYGRSEEEGEEEEVEASTPRVELKNGMA